MSSPVIIKGNKWGITLIIREEASIDSIISILRAKLHNTKSYYKNIRPISITFEGKKLTEDETDAILCTLREIGLNIKPTQTTKYTIKDNHGDQLQCTEGLFFIGDIKSGHSIDATESVVILGNVDTGAAVYSEGNIIIIGELKGYAESGYKGRKDTFVYSLISGGNM
ncbi:MAG: hypothetical protein E7258_09565 [Lachnospiraceae bacterium]|nr:hypothetical protein [Lachnospiraceae bacterium]